VPVELTIVESVTELETTVVEVILESASAPGPAGADGEGVPTGGTTGQRLAKASNADFDTEWSDAGTPGLHASSHEDGGADEISLTGLSGTPAALTTHEADTTSVHGIGDTSALALTANHPSNTTFNDHSARHEDGGADEISLAGLSGTSADLQAHLDDTSDAHDATAISFTPDGSIAATTVQAAIVEVRDEAGGGGAPTDVDYLVGTASGGLSAEIVVGTSPGGELGGTWASPTVDATHSGSTHAAVQAAAEATAASALASHEGDTTVIHGIADTSALALTANHPSNATFNDHSARHEDGGADEITIAGLAGIPTELQTHLDDMTAHLAMRIPFTPAGTIAATDVQAAIEEVASEAGGGSSGPDYVTAMLFMEA